MLSSASRLVERGIVLVGLFLGIAAALPAVAADPTPPSTLLLEAAPITPANAVTFYGSSTTHTVGLSTFATDEPEIAALAQSLLAGRNVSIATERDEFMQAVSDYIRNNINTEFRYGLSKGGRGALIDQSGTAFDQAELMMKLLRAGGITTANYRLGDITLTPAQFGQWAGLVKGLNQTAQTFTVDAKQACRLLADGGIPAVVNGQSSLTSCDTLTGDLTSVTMSHVWVRFSTASYDPAFKSYYLKSGIDVPAAMGCGTQASPTCGSGVKTAVTSGATVGTVSGMDYIENYSSSAGLTQIGTFASNLYAAIQTADRTLASVDVVGGKELNPQSGSLTATYSTRATWTGDIPDQYRTLYQTASLVNNGTSQQYSFFADEIAGRRLANAPSMQIDDLAMGSISYTAAASRRTFPSAACTSGCVTIIVDHPYAAAVSGTTPTGEYGDEQQTFKLVEDPTYEAGVYRPFNAVTGVSTGANPDALAKDFPETSNYGMAPLVFIHSFGQAGESALKHATDEYNVAKIYADVNASATCVTGSTTGAVLTQCANEAQAIVAETVNPYRTMMDALVDGVARTVTTRHHDIGLVYSSRTPETSRITLQESLSIASKGGSDSDRRAGYNMQAITLSEVEGMVSPLEDNAQFSFASMFFRDTALPNPGTAINRRVYQVAPAQMAAFVASQTDAYPSPTTKIYTNGLTCATGTTCWRKAQLQSIAAMGYTTLIMEGGQSELFFNGTTTAQNEKAYTIWEYMKGGAAVVDPFKAAMKTTEVLDASSKARKQLSVSPATGSLTYQAEPDIVTGEGDFPNSLPFVRTFSTTFKERMETLTAMNEQRPCSSGCSGNPGSMISHKLLPAGADANFHERMGGGWDNNYDISLSFTNNPVKNLGADYALDAAGTVARLQAIRDLSLNTDANTDIQTHLAMIVATMYMGGSWDAVVKVGNASTSFHYVAGALRSNQTPGATLTPALIQQGSYTYQGASGDSIVFDKTASRAEVNQTNGTITVKAISRIYSPSTWTFPNGVVVSFDYTLVTYPTMDESLPCQYAWGYWCSAYQLPAGYRLDKVRNNLGRSLTFSNNGKTVTDENGRHADFATTTCQALRTYTNATPFYQYATTCDGFTATDANGLTTTYEYTPTGSLLGVRNNYRLTKIFTPTNATTPFQLIAYDALGRVTQVTDRNGHVTSYYPGGIYGTELWKPSTVVAPNGEKSFTAYNAKGSDIYSRSPLGRISTKTYDNANRVVKTFAPEGNGSQTFYDARNNVVKIRNFSKACSGEPANCTDGINTCNQTLKTCTDDIVTTTDYVGDETLTTCTNLKTCNQPASETDALGNTTNYSWDSGTGQLTQVLAPQVLSPADSGSGDVYVRPRTDLAYTTSNGISFLTSKTEYISSADTVVTSYGYNSSNHYVLSSVVQDAGTGRLNLTTGLTYDAVGNLTSVDGPRADVTDVTTYQWDAGRRILAVIQPDPDGSGPLLRGAARNTYNADDLVTRTETGTTSATNIITTPANLTVTAYTDIVYDQMGLKVQVTTRDAANTILSLTQTKYDNDDRVLCSVLRMNLASTATDACALGSLGSDGPDRITQNTYSLDGELLAVKQAYATQSQRTYATYSYTGNGKKASETDANGNITRLGYDGFDRPVILAYPSPTTVGQVSCSDQTLLTGCTDYESFGYDRNGNKTSQRRRNAATIVYAYDGLNREIRKDVPVWSGTAWVAGNLNIFSTYDLLGRVMAKTYGTTTAGTKKVANSYDRLGRILTTTDMGGRTLSYAYNASGARTQLTFPKKTVSGTDTDYVQYTVDGLNRVTLATYNSDAGGAVTVYGIGYNSLGQRRKLVRNGVGDLVAGEVADATDTTNCVTAVKVTCYQYNRLGQLTRLQQDLDGTASDITWTFPEYNPAGQVKTWGATATTYDYKEPSAYQKNNAYNGLNQDTAIASLATACATATSGYDCAGNLVGEGTGARTFTYDAENRLLTATDPAPNGTGKSLEFTYDTLGRPYLRKVTTLSDSTYVSDYLLFDGVNLVGEYTAGGTQRRRYVFGPGTDEPIAWFEGLSNVSTPRFFFTNYQGSVIAYSDTAGVKQEIYRYGPWGEPRDVNNLINWGGSRFRYTGQMALGDVRLYYYKARLYDPIYGRFLQTDPIGSKDDLDLYAYVSGDPVNGKDPTGTKIKLLGQPKDKAELVSYISRQTGLNVSMGKDGNLKVSGRRDVSIGNANTAKRLKASIIAKTEMTMDVVNGDKTTIVDSYVNNKVDVGDLKKIEKVSGRFAQAALSHVIAERQYNLDNGGNLSFNRAHNFAKTAEAQDMGHAVRWDDTTDPNTMTTGYLDANGQPAESVSVPITPDGNPQ